MTKRVSTSMSQGQIALRQFRQSRRGMFGAWVLGLLYAGALLAGFWAPYNYDSEERNHSYAPPTTIHWRDTQGRGTWPYVRGVYFIFDDTHRRIYQEDETTQYHFQFFLKGESYKFLGLIPTTRHLFGVEAPGRFYLWGADARGRDLFSRICHGARISLSIGLIGVSISFTLGLLIGGLAGYYGGWIDNMLMRTVEMFMMVPGFYLMLALRSAMPDHFNSFQIYLTIVVILSFIGWAGLARIIRGMSISLRERDYVLAARTMGVSDFKIIYRHILPHTFSYSIVAIMLSIPGYIMGEAALSLIGLGIQDPIPSWGNLLSDAMGIVHIAFHPWILIPGGFIFLTVMCFNLVGDTLRDCFDPLFKEAVGRSPEEAVNG